MSQGDYHYNDRDQYNPQRNYGYRDDDSRAYQGSPYGRGEEEEPRVYGRRYDPNLNPEVLEQEGRRYDRGDHGPTGAGRQDDRAQSSAYSNAAYDDRDEWEHPRVYGRRHERQGYEDDYPDNVQPEGRRYGPTGSENQNYGSRPHVARQRDYDDDADDGGFSSPRGYSVSAGDRYADGPHTPRDRQAPGEPAPLDPSADSQLVRSPGMNNLAHVAADGPPLPPRPTVAQSSAPVETQPTGEWTCPEWLKKPARILGIIHVVLGMLLFIFGCIDVSLDHVYVGGLTGGQGIWGGLLIGCAGALIIVTVLKKQRVYVFIAIGLTAGGLVIDIIIFGICGRAIANVNAVDLLNAKRMPNQQQHYYDKYYAIYGLLIIFAYIQFVVGTVAIIYLAVAALQPPQRASFIKENLKADSPTWKYPHQLYKPGMITAVCQIILGVLVLTFGCVEAALQGTSPSPPGFTVAEGIWGGTIIIGAGVLTYLAARLKMKFFVFLVIAVASFTVVVDILIFGICGYIVDVLNQPKLLQLLYFDQIRRPNYGMWTAIYDVLIVLAFIHFVVAVAVIVIHVLVFVPTKYLPKQQKKAPTAQPQARVISQYQGNNRGVPMAEMRPSPADEPRRIDIVDSRDVHVREAPRYEDLPPKYDELPPSPDPYNTGVGYNLSFAPVRDQRPQYQDQSARPYNDRYSGGYGEERGPRYDDRRQRYPSDYDYEAYPSRGGARPYSERDYSQARDPQHYGVQPTNGEAPRHSAQREPYGGETRPRQPSDHREPYGVSPSARHPSESGQYPAYQRSVQVETGEYPARNRDEHAQYSNDPGRGRPGQIDQSHYDHRQVRDHGGYGGARSQPHDELYDEPFPRGLR